MTLPEWGNMDWIQTANYIKDNNITYICLISFGSIRLYGFIPPSIKGYTTDLIGSVSRYTFKHTPQNVINIVRMQGICYVDHFKFKLT